MDLALATGRGPAILADLDGLRPLVSDEDVVVLGHRDVTDRDRYWGRAIFDTEIRRFDLPALRRTGMARIAAESLALFRRRQLDGFWVHVDVDVLDSELMPAVDSPQPDGLRYAEFRELLGPFVASDLLAGIQFTIFDPDLDPNGRYAWELGGAIVDLLGGASSARPIADPRLT